MNKLVIATSAIALLSVAGAAQAAGDAEAGKAKSAMCASCHGPDGNGVGNPMYPKLAGQPAQYLAQTMRDYKSGARSNATMKAMVAGLSDADIENLAAYYASQTCK
jgi:cytochrome c553